MMTQYVVRFQMFYAIVTYSHSFVYGFFVEILFFLFLAILLDFDKPYSYKF